MHPNLNLDERVVARFCESNRIRRLALEFSLKFTLASG
jgi:hypothetical protein